MAAPARTNINDRGKNLVLLVQKPGGTEYFLYGCMTSGNFSNPGMELEEFACRAGKVKAPSGDAGLPTIALESLRRVYPSGEKATNISDDEIKKWVKEGTVINVKYGGIYAGDEIESGPGIFNQQTINGPQTGAATGGVTFNYTEMPVTSILA